MTKLTISCSLIVPLILLLLENGQCTFQFFINKHPTCHPTGQSSEIAGAVYFQTNDPNSNVIIVNAIQPDGTLKFSHSLSTQGKGAYTEDGTGTVSPGSPFVDTLLSQDSVIVGENFLFAVNAGSNSVSMFSINPNNPIIVTFKAQVSSGGDFPVALAYSSSLKMLCVLNGGTKNGVLCYDVDTAQGLITVLPNTARSLTATVTIANPPLRPFGTFSDILFTEKSSQLLVLVKGNSATGFKAFIASYAITGRELAALPIINTNAAFVVPFSLTIVPGTDEKIVVFSDPAYGFGAINFVAGTLVQAVRVAIGGRQAACWSDASPRTGNVYVIDTFGNLIEGYVTTASTASAYVVKKYAATPLIIDARIASLAVKDFLYILTLTAENVQVQIFRLDGPGDAKLISPLVLTYSEFEKKCGVPLNIGAQGMAVFVKQN